MIGDAQTSESNRETTPLITSQNVEPVPDHLEYLHHAPFYMAYFVVVYVFMLFLQLFMMLFTVKCWLNPGKHTEPNWVLPVDGFIVAMLVCEIGTHMFVSGVKHFFEDRPNAYDFAITILSVLCLVPELIEREYGPNATLSTLDFLRDCLRIASCDVRPHFERNSEANTDHAIKRSP